MGYRTLRECLDDLESIGQLVRIGQETDPHLLAAAIQRRVYEAGGPAILFERVRGSQFPMVCNLFGTLDRARYMFRDSLVRVEKLMELRSDPTRAAAHPWKYAGAAHAALHMRPRFTRSAAVLEHQTTIASLPQLTSWPRDGGPFITLPLVYTEHAGHPGWRHSNLGMYRVQLAGGKYRANEEVGLHYQIHRGIGVHHAAAIARGKSLRVNVFVGGPPALTLAAVMPLPQGIPEVAFAGALGGRRVNMSSRAGGLPVLADADFCISGHVEPNKLLPEGPFGDHLGYYSLAHDFPVMRVERVFHRRGAFWPFTTVGRPPQEDTTFGQLIHELTGPVIPSVVPGVHAVHAVDAAGVHPLLLAVGSERYVPYEARTQPRELLTQANALLGQGQMSLAKYLLIAASEDDPQLDVHDIEAFFRHVLCRADWTRDLHFQTSTTIDTLDYSGTALNEGSKVVIAAVGPPRRELVSELPPPAALPAGFDDPRLATAGVLVVRGPKCAASAVDSPARDTAVERFASSIDASHPLNRYALVVVVDDAQFTARNLRNFLWVTFTRSNPAADITGIGEFVADKHWGCRGALVIDARIKPHHAPPLEEDPQVTARVEQLAAPGGPLHGIL